MLNGLKWSLMSLKTGKTLSENIFSEGSYWIVFSAM